MPTLTDTTKSNGKHEGKLAVEGDVVRAAAEVTSEETVADGVYNVRDTIFFRDHTISPLGTAPNNKHIIRIVPNVKGERVLLARIFMHKVVAESLVLERLAVGEKVIASGAGACEMFLATIPNWTPQNLYIDEQNPLTMLVSNMRNFPIRTVGSVVVFKKG